MTRILSKGSELDFADYADWDETANIRDYDLLFANLRDLEQRKDEFLHTNVPREYRRQYELPASDHILELITSGGDIVVTLPTTLSVQPSEDQDWVPPEPVSENSQFAGTPILNLLDWLPFEIEAEDVGGQSVDANSIDEEWEWYFPDQFDWNLSFSRAGGDTDGVRFRFDSLVENGYQQALAGRFSANRASSSRTTSLAPGWGAIYLIPLLDGRGFQDFSHQLMGELYADIDLDTVGRQPDWLGDYLAPREESLKAEINQIQQELDNAQEYKQLLWEQGDELEGIVYTALQDAGLTIEDEVPGRRDGAIDLPEGKIMMEITGTTGGVSESKLRQLQTWVDNNQDELDGEITGLLIINHQRDRNPPERRIQLDEQREAYLDSRGLQLVTTLELFKMINGLATGEISEADVTSKLRSDDGIIVFTEVEDLF